MALIVWIYFQLLSLLHYRSIVFRIGCLKIIVVAWLPEPAWPSFQVILNPVPIVFFSRSPQKCVIVRCSSSQRKLVSGMFVCRLYILIETSMARKFSCIAGEIGAWTSCFEQIFWFRSTQIIIYFLWVRFQVGRIELKMWAFQLAILSCNYNFVWSCWFLSVVFGIDGGLGQVWWDSMKITKMPTA